MKSEFSHIRHNRRDLYNLVSKWCGVSSGQRRGTLFAFFWYALHNPRDLADGDESAMST